jgi:carbon monoxide dehydrogenase subunit G
MKVQAANEILIERPAAAVFAFLADAENDARWRPGVVDIARVAGEGAGAGTRYRQGVKGPGGRRIDADIETTMFEPERRVGFRTTAGPVRPEGSYELTPEGAATRVRFTLEAELRGLKVAMAPAVRKAMTSEVGHLENLKRILEGGEAESEQR